MVEKIITVMKPYKNLIAQYQRLAGTHAYTFGAEAVTYQQPKSRTLRADYQIGATNLEYSAPESNNCHNTDGHIWKNSHHREVIKLDEDLKASRILAPTHLELK